MRTIASELVFQSTLPARGATRWCKQVLIVNLNFNPRSPRGERRLTASNDRHRAYISIHAPREGSDRLTCWIIIRWWTNFNPRSPRGERLHQKHGRVRSHSISIHAPREGSDAMLLLISRCRPSISIHAPREGSDKKVLQNLLTSGDFNPRSPRGERHSFARFSPV